MSILNLCDIDFHWNSDEIENLIRICEKRNKTRIDRIYVGSYFCANYFEFFFQRYSEKLQNVLKKIDVSIVLVIPIFSQKSLDSGKKKITHLLRDGYIKSAVVNDLGMLSWLNNKKNVRIILGRLFAKDTRDFRFPELHMHSGQPKILEGGFSELKQRYHSINAVELENIYSSLEVPNQTKIILHLPYVYQSVGHICCYANMEQDMSAPFLSNRRCKMSCMQNLIQYGSGEGSLLRVGRAVFFKSSINNKSLNRNVDIAYWPLDLWREKYENTSTITRI